MTAVLGFILLKLGYEIGKLDSEDKLLKDSKVVEFEQEEQIYDYLYNQNKTAVFLLLYYPGYKHMENFNTEFERASSKYTQAYWKKEDPEYDPEPQDDIIFMRVHCRKHLNYCMNKIWEDRMEPAAELYKLTDDSQR